MPVAFVFYFFAMMHYSAVIWQWRMDGAACVTRTRDPRITNAMLYQLS